MELTTGRAERAALMAVGITALLAVAKLAVWAATGSLALLSQAVDSLLDIVALVLVLVAVRIARKPADRSHHFGHSKAENLVAFTETVLLGLAVAFIAGEAMRRLWQGAENVEASWATVGVLTISAIVDAARVTYLARAAKAERSPALKAGALNLAGDVGTAMVAIASQLALHLGFPHGDSIGALIVAGVVLIIGISLGMRSVDVLMDRAPSGLEDTIQRASSATAGVQETRRVRVRGEGDKLFADVVVAAGRTASLERAHDIAEAVEIEIMRAAPGIDVVVHVEPTAETAEIIERVQASASRTAGVQEIHNVLVHSVMEGGQEKLHATLHAKTRSSLSLEEAHALSDRVEDAVREELGGEARVDVHIEPMTITQPGRDVTNDRGDIVDIVTGVAGAEPDVLDCHEVVVTETEGRLAIVAHVRGEPTLPLDRIHDASHRIEQKVYAARPEVDSVLIHFEPAE
ncbi:MAG TPA: cation diffusion facilitator family transporter [Actinomycetota bacterium]|nr:cation diffusion facilitator family transporter [Actinomycetota bacterium]